MDYLDDPNVIIFLLKNKQMEILILEKTTNVRTKIRFYTAGFESKRRGLEPKNTRNATLKEKAR